MLAKMKRALASLMAVVMVIGLLPVSAMASGNYDWTDKHRASNFEYHILDEAQDGLMELCYEIDPDTAQPQQIERMWLVNDAGEDSKKFDDMLGGHYNLSLVWGLLGDFIEIKFKPSRIESLMLQCDTKTYEIPVSMLDLVYYKAVTDFYEIFAADTTHGSGDPEPEPEETAAKAIIDFYYNDRGNNSAQEPVSEAVLEETFVDTEYFQLAGITAEIKENTLTVSYTKSALDALEENGLFDASKHSVDLTRVIPEELSDGAKMPGGHEGQLKKVDLNKVVELHYKKKGDKPVEPEQPDFDIPVKFFVLDPKRGTPESGANQGYQNYFPSAARGDYNVDDGMPGDLTADGWSRLARGAEKDQIYIGAEYELMSGIADTDLVTPDGRAQSAMEAAFGLTPGTYEIVWYVMKVQSGRGTTGLDSTGFKADVHVDGYVKGIETAVLYHPNFPDAPSSYTDGGLMTGGRYTVLRNGSEHVAFARPGYTFTGWNTLADGKGTSYSGGEVIDPLMAGMDLYAQWQKDAPVKPQPPQSVDALVSARVECINTEMGHAAKDYSALIADSFAVGEVYSNDGMFQVDVTVQAAPYLTDYRADFEVDHTLVAQHEELTATLSYVDGSWTTDSVTFRVSCETPVVPPQPPVLPEIPTVSVLLDCINAEMGHADKTFAALLEGSYTMGQLQGSAETGYTVDVTVALDQYLAAYNAELAGHTASGAQTKTVTLTYGEQGWSTGSVTFQVICETPVPVKPEVPTIDTVDALLDVILSCVNTEVDHADKTFAALLEGSYTIGSVMGSAETGYTATVAVQVPQYLAAYNAELAGHAASGAQTKTVTLTYVDGAWTAAVSTVTFDVICETPVIPPQPPVLPEIPAVSVLLQCINEQAGHPDMAFDALLEGSYTMGELQGSAETGYTVDVTVELDQYLAAYNATLAGHLSAVRSSSKTITLTYGEQGWSAGSITFPVRCETVVVEQPDVPTSDAVNALLDVILRCTNAQSGHASMNFADLLEGSYTISQVAGDADNGYTATVTVTLPQYLTSYNQALAGHSLAAGDVDSKTVALRYVDGAWTAELGTVPFDVVCETVIVPPVDEGEDTEEDNTTDIPGDEIPLGPGTVVPAPGDDAIIPETDIPLSDGKIEDEETVEIEEDEVPLDAAPKTSDMGAMSLFATLMATSGFGLAVLALGKKRSAK